MMDITVKTLDGQNKQFSIPEETTVGQFKEKISNSIGIPADTQRLIFHGRVLQDEKLLKEYDVHGKVIHVVQRAPPTSLSSGTSDSSRPRQPPHHHHHHHHPPNLQSVVVGSFTIPPDMLGGGQIPIDGSLNVHINLSPVTVPSGNSGSNTTQSTASMNGRNNRRGPGVGVSPGPLGSGSNSVEAAQRIAQAYRNLTLATNAITRLEQADTARTQQGTPDSESSRESPSGTPSRTPSDADSPQGTPSEIDAESRAANVPPNTESLNEGRQSEEAGAPRRTRPSDLAACLHAVEAAHQRLSPYIAQMCTLASEDPDLSNEDQVRQQRMVDQVSETLHALSHCYHNLSDISYELSSPTPRTLLASRPPVMHPNQPQNIVINAQGRNGGIASQGRPTTQQPMPTPTPSVPQATSTTTSNAPSAPPITEADSNPSVSSSSSSSESASATSTPALDIYGDLTSGDDPYVFVEVGPDSLTVNSISTQVVVSHDEEEMEVEEPHEGSESAPAPAAPTTTATSSTPSATFSQTSSSSASIRMPGMPTMSIQGVPSIPGLSSDMVNSIVQSVLQAHGVRQGQPVQVNVVPVQVPGMGMPMLGISGSASINISPNILNSPTPTPLVTATTSSTTATTSASSSNYSAPANDAPPSNVSSSPATSAQGTSAPIRPSMHFTGPRAPGVRLAGPGPAGGPGMFARIPIFRQRVPGPRGLLPVMQPVDIYLPCCSQHYISQGVREMVDQVQRNRAQGNIGNMMAGMMSTLFGQTLHQRGPHVSERQPQQPGGTPQQAGTTNRAQTNTTSTQLGSISANPFTALFSQLLGGAVGAGVGQANVGAGNPVTAGLAAAAMSTFLGGESSGVDSQATGGQAGVITDDAFARLMQGIGAQASQAFGGTPSSETVATFLQSLGENHSIVPGEGFLTDVFLCVAQHLTFANLFSIFLGNSEPMNTLRQPLQQFVRDSVLKGAENTNSNLEAATRRLVDELWPDIQASLSGVDVRPDVDFEATLRGFFHKHLLALSQLILSSTDDASFGRPMYSIVRQILEEFIVLTPMCLQDGQTGFNTMLQNRLGSLTSGLNPLIRQWMTTMTIQHVTTFHHNVTVTGSQLQHYIVAPRSAAESAQTADSSAATASASVPCAQSMFKTQSSSAEESIMEVEHSGLAAEMAQGVNSIQTRNVAQAPTTLDLPAEGSVTNHRPHLSERIHEPGVLVNGNHNSSSSPSASVASPSDVGDSWQEIVPSEWVPVIETDIQRQKSQRPQGPLSDAYLQGMPPKRRRLMNYEQTGNLSNMADYLPSAVKQAAGRVGVEPISSPENLAAEAADAEELHGMLEAEVTRSLTNRLSGDTDYSADRFPNAQQYFNVRHTEPSS